MAFLHRKILSESMKFSVVVKSTSPGKDDDQCDDRPRSPRMLRPPPPPPPPPPPRPPPLSSNHSLSPYLIFMFCGLAVSFLFICYLTFATRFRRRLRSHENTDHVETHQDFINEDLGPVIDHPIWFINTVGLDPSQIESIHVFKYKKGENLIETTDCSVCLSEFEEDESLRLLPKCNHAFHVSCIDTWLRSHKNCPLCRAPIINNTNDLSDHATTALNLTESNTNEETENSVDDSETIDRHVVEDENNGETRVRVHSDLADHHRVKSEGLLELRRSFSNTHELVVSKNLQMNKIPKTEHKLKGSSSSSRIHIQSRVTKSSSFGRSLRKASSFTNKYPRNRSY